jgi:hypothetical protein
MSQQLPGALVEIFKRGVVIGALLFPRSLKITEDDRRKTVDRYPKFRSKLRVATSQILGYRIRPYEGLGIFKMGRRACYLWCPAFRLCIDPFCYFSDCALVAAGMHGSDLFDQHLLEHQRDLAQFSA